MSQLICVAARNCYYTAAISGRIRSDHVVGTLYLTRSKSIPFVHPSVRPSVRPSVHPAVQPSSRPAVRTRARTFAGDPRRTYRRSAVEEAIRHGETRNYGRVTLNYPRAFGVAAVAWQRP